MLVLRQEALWKRNDKWLVELGLTFDVWMQEQRKQIADDWDDLQKKRFEEDLDARKKIQHDLCFGFGGGEPEEKFKKLLEQGE